MKSAEHTIEVDVTPDQFYALIIDFERYPDFVPRQTAARVLTAEPERAHWRVAFELQVAKKLRYTLDLQGDPGRSLQWTLVEGEWMTYNVGGWTLEALDGGKRTRAYYRLDVTLGGFVPRTVTNTLVERTLPETLEAFRKEAERRAH